MKHLKKFESEEDQVELLSDLIKENPLSEDHDFYMFIAGEHFSETKNGLYKKTIEIENMVRITPDKKSISAAKGLEMRIKFQHNSALYHIWLPQDIRELVEGKGSNLEPWLVDLINKYKQRGADAHGIKVLKDVKQRKKDITKYNI